jgi:glutamyl-tRNA synthetase
MVPRLRFAPSPTGQVHIGNIRTAVFNWLFARHEHGRFLLRIEDTDRERSTPEAISTLLEVMAWLGLDYDEEPLYQSTRRAAHVEAADGLLAAGAAYRSAKGAADGAEAVLFRIPWDADRVPGVREVGTAELAVHSEVPVLIDPTGVSYAGVSKKGKPVPSASCLAGLRDLQVLDAAGACLFELNPVIEDVLRDGAAFEVTGGDRLRFTRREVVFHDVVKGELSKPLDSMRDQVIVRSDGSPVFHLANVCDDIFQQVTHIIRGDDHVENTYRHVFLFHALGAELPVYGHLPMIVNASGKPYSKRDGDAFVGDFRAKGYLPQALLNYLSLLGWSPGDDREKMDIAELVDAFTLDRVRSSASQMDLTKLGNLNGRYLAELPETEWLDLCRAYVTDRGLPFAQDPLLPDVARLLQSRTKLLTDIDDWGYFFVDLPEYDDKACRKFLAKGDAAAALDDLLGALETVAFTESDLEQATLAAGEAHGIAAGKLNQPLRVAVTGRTVGAGVFETIMLLGRDRTCRRLRHARETYAPPEQG